MNPEQKPNGSSALSETDFAARQQESAHRRLVTSFPAKIRDIENPSEAVQILAVQKNAFVLAHIKSPSEAVQLAACTASGEVLKIIKTPSEAMQLAAVQQYGGSVRHIQNPSEAVQLMAVQRYWLALRDIKDPSEAVQLKAIDLRADVIQFIKDPSEAVQLAAVQNQAISIRHIQNPSVSAQLAAVQKDRFSLTYIKNPTGAAIDATLHDDPSIINRFSESKQALILQHDGLSIRFIKRPSPALALVALKSNLLAVQFGPPTFTPSPEEVLEAIQSFKVAQLWWTPFLDAAATSLAAIMTEWTPDQVEKAMDILDPALRDHERVVPLRDKCVLSTVASEASTAPARAPRHV